MLGYICLTNQIKGEANDFVVECPSGWLPFGDRCVTLSEVPAYTECDGDKSIVKPGTHNPFFPMKGGICVERRSSAPIMDCTPGGSLIVLSEGGQDEFLCEYLAYEKAYQAPELNNKLICEEGFQFMDNSSDICMASILTVPALFRCPGRGKLVFEVYNEYAFKNQRGVCCEYFASIKGRAWCPEGYRLWGEPFPQYHFGDVIPDRLAAGIGGLDEIQLDRRIFPLGGFQPSVINDAICVQLLAVPWYECNEYDCLDIPYIADVRKIIRRWAFKVLFTDPDIIEFLALPF